MSERNHSLSPRLLPVAALGLLALVTRDAPAEPPVGWRPKDFTGAEGVGFRLAARATPTELRAEDSLTLTVRITAVGPYRRPPRRLELSGLAGFRQFEIAVPSSESPDRYLAADHAWEFDYRLRPRGPQANRIPGFTMSFYNPDVPFEEGRWQTTEAGPVPLRVLPRPPLTPDQAEGSFSETALPSSLYRFAHGPSLLRSDRPVEMPHGAFLILAVGVPPAAALAWVAASRSWIFTRRRRKLSPAARKALMAIQGADRSGDAGAAAAALASYLQDVIGIVPAELTPGEAISRLAQADHPLQCGAELAAFLRTWDALRFAPDGWTTGTELPATAERIILCLEANRWFSPLS